MTRVAFSASLTLERGYAFVYGSSNFRYRSMRFRWSANGSALARETGATVDRCGAAADALQCLSRANYDVIMVNRILARTGESGLDVIRDLIEGGTRIPVMLVSDREDAQEEAVAVGAARGFGKAELGEQSTLDLVARVAKGKS